MKMRILSGHFVDNPASDRVMEKCGFVSTGEKMNKMIACCGIN